MDADDQRFPHLCSDVFKALEGFAGGQRRFDLIILDPPKFAASSAGLERALHAYRKLSRAAVPLLEAGGMLLTFSCSGALDLPAFAGVVFQAARRAEREVRLLETLGAGPDHPQRPDFGRSRYLKGLVLAVD